GALRAAGAVETAGEVDVVGGGDGQRSSRSRQAVAEEGDAPAAAYGTQRRRQGQLPAVLAGQADGAGRERIVDLDVVDHGDRERSAGAGGAEALDLPVA